MIRYLMLTKAIFRFWLIRAMEFRIQVFVWSINSLIWALLGLWAVNLVFGQVSTIAGWTQGEVLILMATQALFNSFLWLFILPSLLEVSDSIRDGKFDFILLKPINSRFLASVRRFEFGNYARILVMGIMISRFVTTFGLKVDFGSVVGFLAMFFLGIFIYQCFFLMLTALNFWFIRIDNLEDLFDSLVVMGRYPTQVFNYGLRFLFFYIIPVAFVATFPVSVLLKKGGAELVLLGLGIASLFYLISNRFWHFALRHYSSASS